MGTQDQPSCSLPGLQDSAIQDPNSISNGPSTASEISKATLSNSSSTTNPLKRTSSRERLETTEEDDAYDKSHFPEYVQVGGKILHRDAIPDDVAQLIDMLGDVQAAPSQSRPPQTDVHARAGSQSALSNPAADTDLSSSDTSSSDDSSESEDESDKSVASMRNSYTAASSIATKVEKNVHTKVEEGHESSDDDEGDGDEDEISLIDPYEQAKMLMAEDKDDDEEDRPSKSTRQPAVVVHRPQVDMTAEEPIQPLGNVTSIVENYLVIHAVPTSSGKILDRDTVLCTSDRKIIGAVEDIVGRVEDPFYAVLFNSEQEIRDEGIEVGMTIHYVERYAKFAMMQPLWDSKGLDVGGELGVEEEEEVYFSDDEKEAVYRSQLRGQKDKTSSASSNRGRSGSSRNSRGDRHHRGGRGRGGNNFRGPRQPRHQGPPRFEPGGPSYPSQPIDYGDDASYIKLERPGTNSFSNNSSPASSRYRHEDHTTRNTASGHGRGHSYPSRGGYPHPHSSRDAQRHDAPPSSMNVQNPFPPAPGQAYGASFPSQPGFPPAPNYNVPAGAYFNPSMMAGQTPSGQALQYPMMPPPPPPPATGQMPAFFPPPPPGFNLPPDFTQNFAQNLAQYFAQNSNHHQNGGPGQQR